MNQTIETPSIYVACLAAYNSGYLHGEWIEVDGNVDELQDRVNQMLKKSPFSDAEEWAIHDYEGFGVQLSEYEGLESVCRYAEFIEEHGEIGKLLLGQYGNDFDYIETLLENYIGCYPSIAEYAQELTEETTQIPEHLQLYIDYEKMGRDMDLNGDFVSIEEAFQKVHLFHNC